MGILVRSSAAADDAIVVPAGVRLLRRLPGRAVWSEGRGRERRVIKAFRRRGLFGPWRDRRRAGRELAVLAALRAAGAPVPEPIGLERRAGANCAALRWCAGARPLERWIDGPKRRLPVPPRVLAERIGTALARLHAAGLRQPDWHLGNLLIDRAGAVWAIDFHQARIGRFEASRALAELASLGGEARERTEGRLLGVAALAWARGLPAELARAAAVDTPAGRRRLLTTLAAAAATARRRRVERDLGRWTRPSGRLVEMSYRCEPMLVRREVDPVPLAEALAAARTLASSDPGTPLAARTLPTGGGEVVAIVGRPAALNAAWSTAARLWEHRLPGLAPLARSAPGASRTWALFARGPRPEVAETATLADRGLQWSGPAPASALDAPLAVAGPEVAGREVAGPEVADSPSEGVSISPRAAPRGCRPCSLARTNRRSSSA